jgi:REP element-mobilizing transposase RayT
MARKLRLEFPGACYHVINRGNYRTDVFRTAGARAAFEECLFEACRKSGWVLHAFVLMRNHYHLAVETPTGNLVAGIQWLQATFANRFNRLRGERGHLFQGRYKALLVEEGAALGQVCHYIHLNPVRAGAVAVARLREYRHSSYWYLWEKRQRPVFLDPTVALADAGGLADNRQGWQAYGAYLAWQAEEGPAGNTSTYACLSRGWALGPPEFKAALIKDHALLAASRAWEAAGAQEIRTQRWRECLQLGFKALARTPEDALRDRKSAAWKAILAAWMKQTTQASNRWLAEQLHMGRPEAVSVYVRRLRTSGGLNHPDYRRLCTIGST